MVFTKGSVYLKTNGVPAFEVVTEQKYIAPAQSDILALNAVMVANEEPPIPEAENFINNLTTNNLSVRSSKTGGGSVEMLKESAIGLKVTSDGTTNVFRAYTGASGVFRKGDVVLGNIDNKDVGGIGTGIIWDDFSKTLRIRGDATIDGGFAYNVRQITSLGASLDPFTPKSIVSTDRYDGGYSQRNTTFCVYEYNGTSIYHYLYDNGTSITQTSVSTITTGGYTAIQGMSGIFVGIKSNGQLDFFYTPYESGPISVIASYATGLSGASLSISIIRTRKADGSQWPFNMFHVLVFATNTNTPARVYKPTVADSYTTYESVSVQNIFGTGDSRVKSGGVVGLNICNGGRCLYKYDQTSTTFTPFGYILGESGGDSMSDMGGGLYVNTSSSQYAYGVSKIVAGIYRGTYIFSGSLGTYKPAVYGISGNQFILHKGTSMALMAVDRLTTTPYLKGLMTGENQEV
jgi:hypothetical protein